MNNTPRAKHPLQRWLTVSTSIAVICAQFSFGIPVANAAAVTSVSDFNMFALTSPNGYSLVNNQPTGSVAVSPNNAQGYPGGSCVPVEIRVTNNSGATGDLHISPNFRYFNGSGVFGFIDLNEITSNVAGDPVTNVNNLNQFTIPGNTNNVYPANAFGIPLSSATSFNNTDGTIASATVTGPFGGNDTSTTPVAPLDLYRHYNITINNDVATTPTHSAEVLFCAHLGVNANAFGENLKLSFTGDSTAAPGGIDVPPTAIFKLPSLTLTKVVADGTATPDQWSFNVSPAINGTSTFPIPPGQNSVTIGLVPPSTYTINEIGGPSTYMFSSGTGTNCGFAGGTATAITKAGGTSTFMVVPVQDASCQFTNKLIPPPTLTVTQTVINDNGGGATSSSFPVFINASSVNAGVAYTEATGTSTVTSTLLPGYTATFGGACAANGTVNLVMGDTKTCTVTYDDQPARLTVVKNVINDNGNTKVASDFRINVSGVSPSTTTFRGDSTTSTVVTMNMGAYAVTESPFLFNASTTAHGYTASFSANCSGTFTTPGESRTCTVTNDDPATATVVVFKNVVNDNGGTKQASDFTMNLTQGTSTASFPGSSTGTSISVKVGAYSVSEIASAGYTSTSSVDCVGTIASGQTKTCTITNDDQPNHITVIKNVVNDNGATSTASAFRINVSGNGASTSTFRGSASGTDVAVNAGAYNVTESPFYFDASGTLHQYLVSYSEDCSGAVTIGQNRTCTITNNDPSTGTLIVIKQVVNDNTGTKKPSDFTMNVTSQVTSTTTSTVSFPGNASGTTMTINVGAYNVNEASTFGYTSTMSPDCSGTMTPGAVKVCNITNDDPKTGTLIVIKHVVNNDGGSKQPGDFTMTVASQGSESTSTASFPGSSSGTVLVINPGAYNVSENAQGYLQSIEPTCSGIMTAGATITCGITNDDPPSSSSGGGGGGGGGGTPVSSGIISAGNFGSPSTGGGSSDSGRVLGAEFTSPTPVAVSPSPTPAPAPTPTPAPTSSGTTQLPRTGLPATLPALTGVLMSWIALKRKEE